ncbi:MAG: flagellar filament capping protein FliD [Undibacterium sp.]|nr:flagellar filament capping protein FliD [Opitutaceae bacterium]
MAGIQVSGLLSNSSFDWKAIVDQLIEAESAPVKKLTADKTDNTDKTTALGSIKTALVELQDSVQAMRADNIFSLRTVSSNVAATTWKTSSASNTPVGSYAIAVSQLATKAKQAGRPDVGAPLSATNNVAGLTLANLNTATAVTAGTFTVNGARVTIAVTDSLQDVFSAISTATGGDVTGTYDPTEDKISLQSASNREVLLGSTVDSSNFLAAMKLANNGGDTVASSGKLGTVRLYTATVANSGLATAASGTGAFSINGVAISYNASTDRVADLLDRINASAAGVTASYDSTNDRFSLANTTTGDTGMSINDTSGLLAALGLTSGSGGAFSRGDNARFTINGGAAITSMSNTLAAAAHGIAGLSVTVDTQSAQTLQVASDSSSMATYVQGFVTKFNAVQNLIEQNTRVTVSGTTVSGAVLAGNREVEGWSKRLRSLAFDQIGGLTGSVKRLDHLGIDFNSTTGQLTIKEADKLATALADRPSDVSEFFLSANTGLVAKIYTGLTTLMKDDTTQQNNLGKANLSIDDQITRLQAKLAAQRETLTRSFIKMLDAQSTAATQQKTLTNAFDQKNNN